MNKQKMAPQEEPKERVVTVYNTTGTCEKSFKSKASNWGELKKDLTSNNVTYQDMKAVLGSNQEELKKDEDKLVLEDMELFITPVKVRSGE